MVKVADEHQIVTVEPVQEPLPENTQVLSLTVSRSPDQVLREAHDAALALQGVIESKPNKVIINGKTYLTFEDWQTVARFYSLSVLVRGTDVVSLQGATGFKARAVVIDNKTGFEVSAAEAMCLDNEARWDSKPLSALLGMAQTRACSRTLRHVLAFVPVLAGYQPTPSEEMEDVGSRGT